MKRTDELGRKLSKGRTWSIEIYDLEEEVDNGIRRSMPSPGAELYTREEAEKIIECLEQINFLMGSNLEFVAVPF